jgi:hypothetical protein
MLPELAGITFVPGLAGNGGGGGHNVIPDAISGTVAETFPAES